MVTRDVICYLPDDDFVNYSIQSLSQYLIQPISDFLSNASLIYFVPHDILHYIPLHPITFFIAERRRSDKTSCRRIYTECIHYAIFW